MRRRHAGRVVPLDKLLAPFWTSEPPLSEHSPPAEWAAHEEWTRAMFTAATLAGYSKLEVVRATVRATYKAAAVAQVPRPCDGSKHGVPRS